MKISYPQYFYSIALISTTLLPLSACFDKTSSTPTKISSVKTEQITLKPVFSNFEFSKPLAMYQSKNAQWFVVEQDGIIKTFNSKDTSTNTFLDISDKVKSDGEMGLLGMALHPDFENNGIFFASYTGKDDVSYISRFQSNNLVTDNQSESIILSVPQPYGNHNGGQISFGPEGYLYIGFGDGGFYGDPHDNGQNIDSLLGALLRIDINNTNTYKIPTDNPFVNKPGKDEIYAYGLRNPWRWSFDRLTHELWLADVGQNDWEEINIIQKGGNYGWNIMEGNQCYLNKNCDDTKYISPIHDYSHAEGQSITGGYVYRGKNISYLIGTYLYADYISGKIWGLSKNSDGTYTNELLNNSSIYISSFAEDQAGNLYIIGHQSGKIYIILDSAVDRAKQG